METESAATYDGFGWSGPTDIDGTATAGNFLWGLSCASSSFCAAVDLNGNAFIYNGSSWSDPTNIDGTNQLNDVSCPTETFCVAVDGTNVFYYNAPPGDVQIPSGTLHITTTSLPNGAPKVLYSTALAASGGTAPYKWSVSSGKLPKGLHLKKSNGVISGKPNKHDSGTYTFNIKVVDQEVKVPHKPPMQNSATKVFSITIS